MGTDIHMYVEKLNKETGSWEPIKGPNKIIDHLNYGIKVARENNDFERADKIFDRIKSILSGDVLAKSLLELSKSYPEEERKNDPELEEEYRRELDAILEFDAPENHKNWVYDGRNYNLFSILASVRNGIGFAGVDTGEVFVPISEPKGFPDDASYLVKNEAESWGVDGHSHSYLTLKELLEYDWERTTLHRGFVRALEYFEFKEKGIPSSYSGDIFGPNIIKLSNEETESMGKDFFLDKLNEKEYYTQISWGESYKDCASNFYTESIPALKELAEDKPENVRIVFWFDN